MACGDIDQFIPLADCCPPAPDGCFYSYSLSAQRSPQLYMVRCKFYKRFPDTHIEFTGLVRYFRSMRIWCSGGTGHDPEKRDPLIIRVNRWDYSRTYEPNPPFGQFCTVASVNNVQGGGTLLLEENEAVPDDFMDEITEAEILADWEALLATPFPKAGDVLRSGYVVKPLGVPPGFNYDFGAFYDSGGGIYLKQPGTCNMPTVFNISGNCQAAARCLAAGDALGDGCAPCTSPVTGAVSQLWAVKFRVNVLGPYCINDTANRTCTQGTADTPTLIDLDVGGSKNMLQMDRTCRCPSTALIP